MSFPNDYVECNYKRFCQPFLFFTFIILFINSWLNFGNAISFKDIDDVDIDAVETYIKNHALENVTSQLEKSIGDECQALLDDDQLVEIFGEKYAPNPSEFKFLRGDRVKIRSIAAFLKERVDGNGNLTGLAPYKMKTKKKKKQRMVSTTHKSACLPAKNNLHVKSIEEMKSGLFERIKQCLESFNINTTDLPTDIVDIEPNRVIGLVQCILCKNESKKMLKPKRVFYL